MRHDPSDPFPPCWYCGSSNHVTANHRERIIWSKQSHRRYSAKIGPLMIDVKLVGIGDVPNASRGSCSRKQAQSSRRSA
jgi:hypothetical protein